MNVVKLLFVCTNNISRSPYAEAAFRRFAGTRGLGSRFITESAGSYPGSAPREVDYRLVALAARAGYDLSAHRCRELSSLDIESFDHVTLLDEDSHWFLRSMFPGYDPGKLSLYLLHSGQLGRREVNDPIVGEGTFEEMMSVVDGGMAGFFEYLCLRHAID